MPGNRCIADLGMNSTYFRTHEGPTPPKLDMVTMARHKQSGNVVCEGGFLALRAAIGGAPAFQPWFDT